MQAGTHVGWGLSSISVLMIHTWGWQATYTAMGVTSLALGALVLFIVVEPQVIPKPVISPLASPRNEVAIMEETDEDLESNIRIPTLLENILNPVNRWILAGTFMRNIATSALS